MVSNSRRANIWLLRLPWYLMAATVLSFAGAGAGFPDDDDVEVDEPPQEQPPEISDATVYGWVFGDGCDAVAARKQLDTLLRQKIAIVDQICGLTETQKQKLRLAGRGDAKRLLDRVDDIGAQIQFVKEDRIKVSELAREAHSLQRDCIKPGLSTDGSLFVKSLERLLTAEQAGKYAPVQSLVRSGGVIRIQRCGRPDILEISLLGTAIADGDLAHLHKLPGLQVLNLDKTQVTSAGLRHLSSLTSLHALLLNDTQVTDEGLEELQRLTELRDLFLDDTQVTDAGLAHLQPLTALQHLTLKDTPVTDAGLAHLKTLTRLQWLVLDNTGVTDAGLAHLKSLSSLEVLLLRRTYVTDSGIAELKRALPLLAIHK